MKKKKIAVAMSGGVDSSTAAAILLQQGHEVFGATMLVCPLCPVPRKNIQPGFSDFKNIPEKLKAFCGCNGISSFKSDREAIATAEMVGTTGYNEIKTNYPPIPPHQGGGEGGQNLFVRLSAIPLYQEGGAGEYIGYSSRLCSIKNAAEVCTFLNILHYIFDLRAQFKKIIIDYFADEYYRGHTPNPCVICNPNIKFGAFMDKLKSMGVKMMATGHYARVRKNPDTGKYELLKGKDSQKDQSYVLYRLNQQQLSAVTFPLGEMTKEETRRTAKKLGIPAAETVESQEVCFIEDDDYIRFLKEYYPREIKPGPIIHVCGKIMGEHKGIIHYTVGQRRRLGIAHPKPLYVVGIDVKNNAVIVGYNEDLFKREAYVSNINWISGDPPATNRILCKIRYRHEAAAANLELMEHGNHEGLTGQQWQDGISLQERLIMARHRDNISLLKKDILKVIFDEPQRAITPGQSAVFYSYPDGEVLLGGGIIFHS